MKRKIAFKKGKILSYNPWNMDAEPGNKMIDWNGNVYRLEERNKDTELYPRKINPPGKIAVKIKGVCIGRSLVANCHDKQ